MILGYLKIGTMPFGPARVKYKRKLPVVGEHISIKEAYSTKDRYSNPWINVRVELIKEGDIWFVSRI